MQVRGLLRPAPEEEDLHVGSGSEDKARTAEEGSAPVVGYEEFGSESCLDQAGLRLGPERVEAAQALPHQRDQVSSYADGL